MWWWWGGGGGGGGGGIGVVFKDYREISKLPLRLYIISQIKTTNPTKPQKVTNYSSRREFRDWNAPNFLCELACRFSGGVPD